MEPTHIVHGIPFIRTGECHRCGACNCAKFGCPHFSMPGGIPTCDVQKTKTEVCELCTKWKDGPFYRGRPIDHISCAKYPNHPGLRVIKEGICGFKFEQLEED